MLKIVEVEGYREFLEKLEELKAQKEDFKNIYLLFVGKVDPETGALGL